MKIGIISDSIDYRPTGVGVYTENLVRCLLKIDKKNEYFLIHHGPSTHPLYQKTKEIKYRFYPRIPLMLQDSLFLSLTKQKFDLVHKPNPTAFLFPIKFPTIATVFDLSYVHYRSLSNMPHQFFYSLMVKKTLRNCSRIIAISKYTKEDVIRTFNVSEKKIDLIYGGAVNPCYRKLSKKDIPPSFKEKYHLGPYILFTGTIEARKNVATLIKAFSKIKKHYSGQLSLILVGKVDSRADQILNEVRQSEFSSDIILPGYVDGKELQYFYNLASVFVYPSLFEGFGIPVLEAMACGCPVIISNATCLPEIAGQAALQINPEDVDGLAKTMERVLIDKVLRKQMIDDGYRQAKKFSWQKCARETLQVYQKTVLR